MTRVVYKRSKEPPTTTQDLDPRPLHTHTMMNQREEILSDLNEALDAAERIQWAAQAMVDELREAIEVAEDEETVPNYENLGGLLGNARQEWNEAEGGLLDTDNMIEDVRNLLLGK